MLGTTGARPTETIFYKNCTIWSTRDGKWQVLVNDEGVIDSLGTYDRIEKAIEIYQQYKQTKKEYNL